MGVFRKITAVSTLGAVNMHSKRERKVGIEERRVKGELQAQADAAGLERARFDAEQAAAQAGTPAARIAALDDLLARGLITPAEHAERRTAVINVI